MHNVKYTRFWLVTTKVKQESVVYLKRYTFVGKEEQIEVFVNENGRLPDNQETTLQKYQEISTVEYDLLKKLGI